MVEILRRPLIRRNTHNYSTYLRSQIMPVPLFGRHFADTGRALMR